LDLSSKLLSITADSASNNEKLAFILEETIYNQSKIKNTQKKFTAHNFIRCIAHVINLYCEVNISITESWFKMEEAFALLDTNSPQKKVTISSIMKVRSLSVYIKEIPQRQEKWVQLIPKNHI